MSDEPSEVKYRAKMLKSKSRESLLDMDSSDTVEKKIESLEELFPGDHIVLSVDLKNFCHGIVDSVDHEKNIIDFIYYDDTATQCALDEYMLNDGQCVLVKTPKPAAPNGEEKKRKWKLGKSKSKPDVLEQDGGGETIEDAAPAAAETPSCRAHGVKKSALLIDLSKIEVYKVFYDVTKEKTLPAEKTLEKARRLVGQEKYNVFLNNDEHFSIYCKTGKAAKLFIINPKDISAKNIIGKSIPEKIAINLAQESGQILLVNTAKHIATRFPRSAFTAGLPAAAEVAGGMIGVTVEGFSMTYDIYQKVYLNGFEISLLPLYY
jgi:hypothetical protein